MKTSLILSLALLVAGTVAAQEPKKDADHSAKTDVNTTRSHETLIVAKPAKSNEIVGRKVIYSGVAVQVIKSKEPLQLINPFAPGDSPGDQNLDRDMFTHRPAGFKIFSISF